MSVISTKGRELCNAINTWQPIDLREAVVVLKSAMSQDMEDTTVFERLICAQLAWTVAWRDLEITIPMLQKLWPIMKLEEDEALSATIIVRNIQKCGDLRVDAIARQMLSDHRPNIREQAMLLFGETYGATTR